LAFFDFPAEHWVHLRTSNPIESIFATVRHRTVRAKPARYPSGLPPSFPRQHSARPERKRAARSHDAQCQATSPTVARLKQPTDNEDAIRCRSREAPPTRKGPASVKRRGANHGRASRKREKSKRATTAVRRIKMALHAAHQKSGQAKLPLDCVELDEFLDGKTSEHSLVRSCRFVQVISNRSVLFVRPKQVIR
jgi:hypothetical protein